MNNNSKHYQKVMVFVFGMLRRLVEAGILLPGRYSLANTGLKLFDEIKNSGFRPSKEDVASMLGALELCKEEDREAMVAIIMAESSKLDTPAGWCTPSVN